MPLIDPLLEPINDTNLAWALQEAQTGPWAISCGYISLQSPQGFGIV